MMNRKLRQSPLILVSLVALLSASGLFIRAASARLDPPIVDVIPSQAYINQDVLVTARINVVEC